MRLAEVTRGDTVAHRLLIRGISRVAGYRLRTETGAQAWLILVGIAVTLVVLAFFAVDTVRNAPETFTAIVVVAALAVVFDIVWKRVRGEPPAVTSSQGEPT